MAGFRIPIGEQSPTRVLSPALAADEQRERVVAVIWLLLAVAEGKPGP